MPAAAACRPHGAASPPAPPPGGRTGLPWRRSAAPLRLPPAVSGQQCAQTRLPAELSQRPFPQHAAPQHEPALRTWWQPSQRRSHEQLPDRRQPGRAPDTAADAGRRLQQLRSGKLAASLPRSAAAARGALPPASVQMRQWQPGPLSHRRLHSVLPHDQRHPATPLHPCCANVCNEYCSNRVQGRKA